MDAQQVDNILAENAAAEADDIAALEAEEQQSAQEPGGDSSGDATAGAGDADAGEGVAPEAKAPQTVPLAVHIRERERFRAEREAWQQQQAVVNQRLEALFASQQARTQAAQNPMPDKDTDPIGYNIWLSEQNALAIQRQQQEQAQHQQRQQAMEAQARAVQHVAEKINADEREFLARTPDYKEAVAFLADLKRREYTALGMPEEAVRTRLQQDAWALAIQSTQDGVNAADYAYQLAQALGYQKANPQKQQGTNVLAMRSNGARTNASGGAGGRSGAPTFADLAAMDNAEFEKMTAGDNWQKFAG